MPKIINYHKYYYAYLSKLGKDIDKTFTNDMSDYIE